MGKTQVNVQLDEERLAKVDRMRREIVGVRCGSERSQFVAWLLNSAIDALVEEPVAPKPRKVVARPFPAGVVGPGPVDLVAGGSVLASFASEGARLKAARVAAKLTQQELAERITKSHEGNPIFIGGVLSVSRDMVQRAERAASLDEWPALRQWLLEQGAKPAAGEDMRP